MQRSELLEHALRLARSAGSAIMEVYATPFEVRDKADASPVTAADERAEAIIVAGLRALDPAIPVVAEEEVAAGRVPAIGDRFWLVDPLDGTREFVGRNGEFTVNIALIEHGRPVLGVVYAPALDRMYGGAEGVGAFVERDGTRRDICCRSCPAQGFTVVASRSHNDPVALEAFLQGKPIASMSNAGSALKLALIAAGEADLYPRLGRTMEWDIAAGHAIVNAAGGRVTCVDGSELRYGKPGFENPHFVAIGVADA
jgi:3'(2'), 5'-bisphosphate nucleotidase